MSKLDPDDLFRKMQNFWQTGRGGPEVMTGLSQCSKKQLLYLSGIVPRAPSGTSTGANLEAIHGWIERGLR